MRGVALLAVILFLVPGATAARTAPHCGPFFLVRLPSLGTLTWRTVAQGGKDWHGLGYRPAPPVATTDVRLHVGGRLVARRRVNEEAVRFPSFADRMQLVTLSQLTEPGTLRASIAVDFKPGEIATYCAPYLPPGLKITLLPRSN
jgi:hypothetical protein